VKTMNRLKVYSNLLLRQTAFRRPTSGGIQDLALHIKIHGKFKRFVKYFKFHGQFQRFLKYFKFHGQFQRFSANKGSPVVPP
jgi:hypothetical protein